MTGKGLASASVSDAADVHQRPEEPPRGRDAEPVGFQRFPLFDSARAIAVLLVVAIHSLGPAGIRPDGFGSLAIHFDVGVTIFFLISGFLLYRPFAVNHAEGTPQPSTGAYAWRRILRIVPAYWLALTVAALLLDRSEVFTPHGALAYYGFGQIYGRDTFGGGLSQAWSLDVEITFYAFLPLYALAVGRALSASRSWYRVELWGLAILICVSTIYKLAIVLGTSPGHPYSPALQALPGYLDHFAIGMGLAVLSVSVGRRQSVPKPLSVIDGYPALPWLGACIAFLLIVALDVGPVYGLTPFTHPEVFERHWLYALVALGVLLPVAFGDPRRGLIRRILGNRALLYLGTVSYGVYLWHRPVIEEAGNIGVNLGIGPSGYLFWFLFTVLISGLIAVVSWHLLERPILSLKRLIPDRARGSAGAPIR